MIRRLDPDTDRELYRQCWEWREKYPRSLRDATAAYSVESFEEFLDLSRLTRADVGIFNSPYRFMEEELIAVVSIQWAEEGIYEIHVSAKRGIRIEQMIEPCLNIQKTIFEDLNAQMIFAFTPEWNRGAIRLATTMGLRLDGVRKISGATNARVIVWMRLIMTKADYVANFQTEPNTDGIGSIYADHDAGNEYTRHQSAA